MMCALTFGMLPGLVSHMFCLQLSAFVLAMYSSMAVGPSSGSCQTVDNGGGESSTSYELVEQGIQAEAVVRALQGRCREG